MRMQASEGEFCVKGGSGAKRGIGSAQREGWPIVMAAKFPPEKTQVFQPLVLYTTSEHLIASLSAALHP